MLYNDTIAAIATPAGIGGIGVVRLSGAEARPILEQIFVPTHAGRWQPFRMRLGKVITSTGATIDEALAVYMRAPRSFTAEDVVEISCHGGPLVVSHVLQLTLEHGARLAEPGEFTMRAFLNGRVDLTQAEATLDIINARTETSLALAQTQLGGWLASELRVLRETLLGPLAYFTALVDFPEDEVEPQEVVAPLQEGLHKLEQLLATSSQGMLYRHGARAALVGIPNVGKSSLLNALLRADRAIVTPIPGTTRDTLEETANLNGIPVVLVDTAGITETDDLVEQIGITRSRTALAHADVALLVFDVTRDLTEAEIEIAGLTQDKPTILIFNKADLHSNGSVYTAHYEHMIAGLTTVVATVTLSALTGTGIDDLVAAITATLLQGVTPDDTNLITNARHRDTLERAATHMRDALDGYSREVPPDLLAIDITSALTAIGEVTGESVNEDLLATIFSRFCIGK
ncbi:MAG: tRNA uridine-5-carboxymethylaminomethyl(34) synthesis GTPase MnmE [Chloroflexi bacterium AL-W]|nr:tRNA uridine-5-carboxymethylaminomethyl(34) synthesis GTPase MnmE [Chloroflexi bacterium AL-N1]NOK66113.1 tRNA uridine-5-carboxymethylaminomethyl(34) synthesis GTPase MnmE [Chloroflexi bacterium AL-N10]NOK72994.1 tRNA uridine-5-carboxymethylaminomethyl(34) synthesis GTPase MnmE [Chloroflexi bacterium AL-N5]NOK79891.1 tRNA uridine-5-carboxymethylaminomethyl(34) synthesis GTPase MnmE [Chloroflexi bacterium AL-W]NOK88253.1 tRNA uridine-5-carboxymethylaminomethyl(34) synthesis GTPase MnmE [Chlor